MVRYLARRVLQAIPTFLGITLITFVIIKLAPGDLVLQMTFNPRIKVETREKIRRQLGLDKPVYVQYVIWLLGNDWMQDFGPEIDEKALTRGVLRLDFGKSYLEKRPATEMILERVPNTIQLNIAALLISYALGVPIGIYSAARQNSMFVEANFKRDYPVVLAGFVIGSIAVILGNLLSDILYALVDPRIRLQ